MSTTPAADPPRTAADPQSEVMSAVLAQNWWAIAIRGVLAILFGLIAFFMPAATMLSLVLVFAAYSFVDGVFAIVAAVRSARRGERWGMLVLEGVIGIVIGVLAVAWPGLDRK